MGGSTFSNWASGKNEAEAFQAAVEQARWEYGNEGYTGTIAEKHGFKAFALPPRVSTAKFLGWIDQVSEGEDKNVPKEHVGLVMEAFRVYDDKWGPALCLIPGLTEQKAEKERAGLKKTQKKMFLFCGWASS